MQSALDAGLPVPDHPEISDDQSDASPSVAPRPKRRKADPGTVEQCEEWLACLGDLHRQGWLHNPDGLYIIDDTAFTVTNSTVDLYSKRKNEEEREIMTVLASGTAGGRILRPLILYNENFNVREKFRGTEDKCWLGANDSGLLDASVFLDYVQNEVLPSMNAEKNVIFVNAQMSEFLDEDFILECVQSEKTIRVVILPAGQATRNQALDLRAFGPVKRHWKDFINGLSLTLSEGIDEQNFAARLMQQWEDFHMADTIVSAFSATGICPYDPVTACQDFPVKKKPDPPKDYGPYIPPRQIYSKELKATQAALRQITGYTDIDVENIMAFVVNTLNEACNRTPSYAASEKPRKKRKTGK